METLVGQTLNRYQITSLLGEGGMGAVYKARDVTLQRDVAIKVMHSQYTRQQNFQERFLQEARVAARLDHPGIVKVYDFGEARGMLYIVMEFIPGQNLRKMLQTMRDKGQWIVLDESIKIIQAVSLALDYAHRQGVLHRDMKPDNIMLKPEPAEGLPYRPVITDLGLAKLVAGGVMTQDGTSMGTPAYMSPEQAMGEKTDACSDVYALGILLYELCVGKLPFPIRTLSDAIRYHVKEPPPDPRTIRPDLPEPLARIILKAIAKRPADRYAHAAELAQALGNISAPAARPQAANSSLAQEVSLVTQLQGEVVPRGPSLAGAFPKPAGDLTRDRVQVLEKDHTGKTLQLKAGGMTIGRDEDNDIVLHDTKSSRHHARIEFDGANYRVTDLNSTNGTYLGNAKLLPGIAELWTPDKFIQIGDSYLRLERAQGVQGSRMMNASAAGGKPSIMLSNGTMVDTSQIRSSSGEGRIGLYLDATPLSVAPGSMAPVTVLVLNQGPVVDQVRVAVSGIPAEWSTVTQPVVQLMPGDQKEVTVNIRPPLASQSRAGRYQVAVRASSTTAPNQTAEARTGLTVQPFTRFTTDLRPQRIKSGAPARLTITNQGNLQETFAVEMQDRGNEMNFTPAQYRLTVAEGQAAAVEFRASPRQRVLVGGEKMTPFNARIAASTGDPQVQSGEIVSRGLIPPWVLGIIPILLACLIGAGILAYTQMTGQQASATQTAVAVVHDAEATRSSQGTQVAFIAMIGTQSSQGTQVAGSAKQTAEAYAAALTQVAKAQTQTLQAFKSPTAIPNTVTPTPTRTATPTVTNTPIPPGAWQGDWVTTCELLACGNLSITQTGNTVAGTYAGGNGHINGSVDGARVHGTWTLGGASGDFDFWLSADGKTWQGNWNHTFEWCGNRNGGSAPSPCGLASWYGDWSTICDPASCGPMTLIQNGSDIIGTYASGQGQVKGTVSGTVLNGQWTRGGSSGSITFFMIGDGSQFNGNFDDSNQWCGFRSGSSQPNPCLAKQMVLLPKYKLPIDIVKLKPWLILPTPTPTPP